MTVPNIPFYLSQANQEFLGTPVGYASVTMSTAGVAVPGLVSQLAGLSAGPVPTAVLSLYVGKSAFDYEYQVSGYGYGTYYGAPYGDLNPKVVENITFSVMHADANINEDGTGVWGADYLYWQVVDDGNINIYDMLRIEFPGVASTPDIWIAGTDLYYGTYTNMGIGGDFGVWMAGLVNTTTPVNIYKSPMDTSGTTYTGFGFPYYYGQLSIMLGIDAITGFPMFCGGYLVYGFVGYIAYGAAPGDSLIMTCAIPDGYRVRLTIDNSVLDPITVESTAVSAEVCVFTYPDISYAILGPCIVTMVLI